MFHATPTPLDRAEEALQQFAAAWRAQSLGRVRETDEAKA